jgi:hypothetical protein
MYSGMSDSLADALRRDSFESRVDERFLVAAFQKEIAEQIDEIQQLRQNKLEQRTEIDYLSGFYESLKPRCSSPERQTIFRMPFHEGPPQPQRYCGDEGPATLGATAPPRYCSRSINPAASQFKPEPFKVGGKS